MHSPPDPDKTMTQPQDSQHDLVVQQFGPRAAAYASSATHAAGPDLAAFQAILRDAPVDRLLDLGCGGGHASFHAAPHAGSVVAYDLSADMLGTVATGAAARGLTNIRTQQGRAEQLLFADGDFDMVASRYSAHHWRQVPVALAEAARVLRPHGRLVMMDVFAPADPLLDSFLQTVEMVRDPSHVRDYSLLEWRDMLSAVGLKPGPAETYRLRLAFQPWVDRIGSPESHRPALRSLLAGAAAEVKQHFAVEADGSFTIDTMLMVAVKES